MCENSVKINCFTMPYHKRTHDENLKVVCANCFCKAKRSQKITPKIELKLRQYIQNYNIADVCSPSVLCGSCYIKLSRGQMTIRDQQVKIRLKRNEDVCSCEICVIASTNPAKSKSKTIHDDLQNTHFVTKVIKIFSIQSTNYK